MIACSGKPEPAASGDRFGLAVRFAKTHHITKAHTFGCKTTLCYFSFGMKKVFMKKLPLIILFFPIILILCGWGYNGHKIINNRCVYSFPGEMAEFQIWQPLLEQHASDADERKSTDPTEGPKHYIDIDNYPEFLSTGHISQSFDSAVAIHGLNFVMDQGILPWAIINTYDSLVQSFLARDWEKAVLFAADLGHYVADGHMPLHITRNYNGQYTGQTGIHSRYESSMINRYYSQINYAYDTALFIDNIPDFVFSFLYLNYLYTDSVLAADLYARGIAGNTTSDLYYLKLWEFSAGFTTTLYKNASDFLGAMIYSAWITAGSPSMITSVFDGISEPGSFRLNQNYPNPFNPATTISFSIPLGGPVKITIYNINGEAAIPPDEAYWQPGINCFVFNGSSLSSGIYLYAVSYEGKTLSGKMVLLK